MSLSNKAKVLALETIKTNNDPQVSTFQSPANKESTDSKNLRKVCEFIQIIFTLGKLEGNIFEFFNNKYLFVLQICYQCDSWRCPKHSDLQTIIKQLDIKTAKDKDEIDKDLKRQKYWSSQGQVIHSCTIIFF